MGNPLELVVIRVIDVEVKSVSDHPLSASTGRKIVCSLARLRSWTSGQLEEEFCAPLPPEASEMPLKREPEASRTRRSGRIEGETLLSKGCQLALKPRPGSYSSALLKIPLLLCPPATSTLPEGSSVAV